MDVGIKRPFKNVVRDEYEMWHADNDDNGAKVQRADVANWIKKAWSEIRQDTTNKTWRHIGWNFSPGLNVVDLDLDQDLEDFMQVLANDLGDEDDNNDIKG
jgi:hypothetical protein